MLLKTVRQYAVLCIVSHQGQPASQSGMNYFSPSVLKLSVGGKLVPQLDHIHSHFSMLVFPSSSITKNIYMPLFNNKEVHKAFYREVKNN